MMIVKPQEEKFLRGIMQGMNQYEAYLYAYPEKSHWKRNAIDNRASELLKRGELQVRLAEMQTEAGEANAITRDFILTRLKDIATAPIDLDKIRPADQVRALEMMAKILGIDSPPGDEDD